MRAVAVPEGAAVSVAVRDLRSGRAAGHGDRVFATASIVKVDILAALLLGAQDAGRWPAARERAAAAAMIGTSDNEAASALWRTIGGAAGLDAANERLGLTGTRGGDGPRWGLTRTTAAEQLMLLEQVFGERSQLHAAGRRYVEGLMGRVVPGQDWGVSAVADGSAWALKNGWMPRSTTGRWTVHSIGRVTVRGRDLLLAVLSDGSATREAGVSLVESAARAAVSAFTGDGRAGPGVP
ncbi:serine hydrolase [Streptomyces sp. K1PA1]|uniref:Serine hydrolase n=1 Tax=Streptomyces tropicalis TaxID=3034234 RepID=A0ABT6A577_9ACTN|nr:serine hydrolase [Streptomyces tropicalis]MDF3299806.1 serine hydrolase [Streptomyces tropicalis]